MEARVRHGGLLDFTSFLAGKVLLKSHVDEILVEGGRAVGVRLRSGQTIRAHQAVVSQTLSTCMLQWPIAMCPWCFLMSPWCLRRQHRLAGHQAAGEEGFGPRVGGVLEHDVGEVSAVEVLHPPAPGLPW